MAITRAKIVARDQTDKVNFTHPDKVMFPDPGYTKRNVLEFYQKAAPLLLPHLRNRPTTLERLPDGLTPGGPRFWQKNIPSYYPDWIPRVELPTQTGAKVKYALVNDLDSLLYLVNQGTLTFHIWLSRIGRLDIPDYVLFDLDPQQAKFSDVVKIALRLRDVLSERKVKAFVKTSGKTGLHVLTPWTGKGGYDSARDWAMQIALQLVQDLPGLATMERFKNRRRGRVYIDVIQNAKGHHVVPPYVLRAVPHATVSTPLEWKELVPTLDPNEFTLPAALRRFAKLKNDLMGSLTF